MNRAPSTIYIRETIESAQTVFARYGTKLEENLKGLFTDLKSAICESKKISRKLGIDEICKKCDLEDGGSCCGKGIENYYDVPLLLANIALGTQLPERRFDKLSCYFLGPKGCVLLVRHTICVNFLCKRIYDYLNHEEIVNLQRVYGEEIHLTFVVHEKILEFLRSVENGRSHNKNH